MMLAQAPVTTMEEEFPAVETNQVVEEPEEEDAGVPEAEEECLPETYIPGLRPFLTEIRKP